MVFLDTNIWIELLAVATPQKEYQVEQAQAASRLLKEIRADGQKIITCKEQLIELIHAVMKIQMSRFNRLRKEQGLQGVGGLKQFRKSNEFSIAKEICLQACHSIKELAVLDSSFSYDVENILASIEQADINDIMYCTYCQINNIQLYTFDKDMNDIDCASGIINVLNSGETK